MREHFGGEDGTGYILAYPHLPIFGRNIASNNIQHNRDSDMEIDKKN